MRVAEQSDGQRSAVHISPEEQPPWLWRMQPQQRGALDSATQQRTENSPGVMNQHRAHSLWGLVYSTCSEQLDSRQCTLLHQHSIRSLLATTLFG